MPKNPVAFPFGYEPGMTLRDYFAAAAIQGLLACPGDWSEETHWERAKFAYEQANALLDARNEK